MIADFKLFIQGQNYCQVHENRLMNVMLTKCSAHHNTFFLEQPQGKILILWQGRSQLGGAEGIHKALESSMYSFLWGKQETRTLFP